VKRKREDALLARVLEGGVRKREREWMVSVVRSRILQRQCLQQVARFGRNQK
jgi:hypothetical protein